MRNLNPRDWGLLRLDEFANYWGPLDAPRCNLPGMRGRVAGRCSRRPLSGCLMVAAVADANDDPGAESGSDDD